MNRVILATLIAPLIISVCVFFNFFWVTYPLVLIFTILFGLPIFFVFYNIDKLEWWFSVLAGASVSLIYCILSTHDLDFLLSRNNLIFMAMGIGLSLVFWWIAVFRNPIFESVSASLPATQLILIPIFIVGTVLYGRLTVEHNIGRVQSIHFINTYPIPSKKCEVTVRLSSGEKIHSDFWGCDWPRHAVVDRCFHLDNRWSTLRFRRVYSVSSRLGGDSDEC